MITYKLKYFKTEEHSVSDVGDFIDDTYYSEKGAIDAGENYLYLKLYHKIEIYSTEKVNPIYVLHFSKFNRTEYKQRKTKKDE